MQRLMVSYTQRPLGGNWKQPGDFRVVISFPILIRMAAPGQNDNVVDFEKNTTFGKILTWLVQGENNAPLID